MEKEVFKMWTSVILKALEIIGLVAFIIFAVTHI